MHQEGAIYPAAKFYVIIQLCFTLESAVNPPAAPINLAAVDAPIIVDKLGAMNAILLST